MAVPFVIVFSSTTLSMVTAPQYGVNRGYPYH